MSLRKSRRRPWACSGLMYSGVPTMFPVAVTVPSPKRLATPKSISGAVQPPPLAQDLLEIPAARQLHGDVEQPPVLAVVVDRAYVLVAHAPRELDLGLEAVGHARVAAEVGAQHLDRHHLVERAVARLVDRPHAAAAELALDLVAAVEERPRPQLHRGDEDLRRLHEGGAAGGARARVGLVLGPARRTVHARTALRDNGPSG